jgi:hypothetical protein
MTNFSVALYIPVFDQEIKSCDLKIFRCILGNICTNFRLTCKNPY